MPRSLNDTIMKKALLLASAALLSTTFSYAASEGWITDFEAAKKQAAEEKKDIILDFTGSDWCPPCKMLNEQVLSKEAFLKGVRQKYILVELDFPRGEDLVKAQGEAQAAANAKIRDSYKIQGYPTILLTDAQGRPYAKTGFQPGGPEKYLAHLSELQKNKEKRDAAFVMAEKMEGVEKAKALYQGVKAVPKEQHHVYEDIITEIKKLDPKDETGLAKAAAQEKALLNLEEGLGKAINAGETDKAMKLIDDHVSKFDIKGEEKQEVLSTKLSILLHLEKFDEADKMATEIIAIAPESALAQNIKGFQKTQLAEMRKAAASEE